MLVKKFDVKTSEGHTVCGIKESYSTVRQGDLVKIQAIIGVSSSIEPTVLVYSKNDKFIKISEDFNSVEDFINTRNPFYSLLETTMMICELDIKVNQEDSTISGDCNLYVPQKIVGSELLAVKASSKQTVGCLYIPLLESMKSKILEYVAETPLKNDIIAKRCNQ